MRDVTPQTVRPEADRIRTAWQKPVLHSFDVKETMSGFLHGVTEDSTYYADAPPVS